MGKKSKSTVPRPRRSLWTAADAARHAAGPSYPRGELLPVGVMPPRPVHAQTAASEAARVSMREYVMRGRAALEVDVTRLVTRHAPPWSQIALDELPSAALAFARVAERSGLEVAARAAGDKAVQVGVRERDRRALWIRATWARTAAGAWRSEGALAEGKALGVTAARALMR